MATSAKTRSATVGRAYQMLPVVGPSAGLDLRVSPTLLKPEQARTLVNYSLSEPGALVVRKGYAQFSTTSLGNQRIQGAARIYLNTAIPNAASTSVTVAVYNQSLYTLSDGGVWSAAWLTGLSTSEISFPSDRDLVAALDGSTRVMKSTNGSSWTLFGILPGTVASTLTAVAGGGLSSAEFEFTYAYKARGLAVYSNASTALSTVTRASTGAVELQIPNSTDLQVDAIAVYARNKTAGETVLRKASSFAVQGGAHSTITITSSAWTSNDEEPTDHDVPPALSFGVVWKNRWWARSATVSNRIHFTQLFQPQSWPALFYLDIPFERGDAIQALVPLGDTLLIFGTTKIFVIIGQTSLDFEVRPTLASQDGAFGFRACAVLENGVVHAGASGLYIFDGATDKLLSYALDPAWRDLVGNTAQATLAKVAVTYHKKEKELRLAVPRRYPSGTDGEWVLDLNRTRTTGEPAWSATDRNIGGYIPWDGPEPQTGDQGRLLTWDSTKALVFEEATGTSANSSNLVASYEGPGLTLGAFRGRWIDLRGEYEPHAGALTAEAVVDGVSQGVQSIAIGAGLSVYGTATYGSGTYAGSGRRQFFTHLPLSADGRTYVQKFTYTGKEAWRLYSYHLGLVPESRSRAFSE